MNTASGGTTHKTHVALTKEGFTFLFPQDVLVGLGFEEGVKVAHEVLRLAQERDSQSDSQWTLHLPDMEVES